MTLPLVETLPYQEGTAFKRGKNGEVISGVFLKSNGTSGFFKVKGGSPVGKITATGKYRPCGKTRANEPAGLTGVHAFTVNEADGLKAGDVGTLYSKLGVKGAVTIDGDGASAADVDCESKTADGLDHTIEFETPVLGVLGTLTIAGSPTEDIVLRSNEADGLDHIIVVVDPGVESDLKGDSHIDATTGVETVTVTLENSAVPAIAGTVADVVGMINATAQKFQCEPATTEASTPAAVGATPLANGVAAPADKDLTALATRALATDVESTVVTLGLNDLGTALASTVSEALAAANAASQTMEFRLAAGGTGGNTAAVVAPTALAGGIATGAAIASARTISAVVASDITLSGAVFNVADDDLFYLDDGSGTALGYLDETVDTSIGTDYTNEDVLFEDQSCRIFVFGMVEEDDLEWTNTDIKTDLSHILHL